jgi:hypothetical protein
MTTSSCPARRHSTPVTYLIHHTSLTCLHAAATIVRQSTYKTGTVSHLMMLPDQWPSGFWPLDNLCIAYQQLPPALERDMPPTLHLHPARDIVIVPLIAS